MLLANNYHIYTVVLVGTEYMIINQATHVAVAFANGQYLTKDLGKAQDLAQSMEDAI